jgi:hypothetical protein
LGGADGSGDLVQERKKLRQLVSVDAKAAARWWAPGRSALLFPCGSSTLPIDRLRRPQITDV